MHSSASIYFIFFLNYIQQSHIYVCVRIVENITDSCCIYSLFNFRDKRAIFHYHRLSPQDEDTEGDDIVKSIM